MTREEYIKEFGIEPFANTGLPTNITTPSSGLEGLELPPTYTQRVGQSFQRGFEDITTGLEDSAVQMASGAEEFTQATTFGGAFKGLGKTIGGTARAALRPAGAIAKTAFAPVFEVPGIKQATEYVGEKGMESKFIGAEKNVGEQLAEWQTKHPQAAKDIENIVDISILFGGKGAQKPAGEAITKTGEIIERGGLSAAKAQREAFVQELVGPIKNKAVKEAGVARTTETGIGPFKRSVVAPTRQEAESAIEVARIPGVTAKNTFQRNYNAIAEANTKLAEGMRKDVVESGVLIPRQETLARLDNVTKILENEPLIVGDAERTAQKLLNGAKKFVEEEPGTAEGILNAKIKYDKWVGSQKRNPFDSATDNAFTIANREVRNTFKDLLDESVKSAGVRESLRQQHALYNAMDALVPKAAKEADTAIGRVFQKMSDAVGTKNKAVQIIGATVGLAGFGAAAAFAPAAAIAGVGSFIVYRSGRMLLRPELRIALGQLLKETGKSLTPAERKVIENAINGKEITDGLISKIH